MSNPAIVATGSRSCQWASKMAHSGKAPAEGVSMSSETAFIRDGFTANAATP